MKHLLALLATTALIGVSPAAHAVDANVKSDFKSTDNGGYETTTKTERTTAAGTVKEAKRDVDVDVDDDGETTKTVKSKAVNDPKGLMNKQKMTGETKTTKNADGSYERKSSEDKTDAAGTDVSVDAKSKVEVDANGDVITKTTLEKKFDPKGLFNTKETETEIKMKNGQVIHSETDDE